MPCYSLAFELKWCKRSKRCAKHSITRLLVLGELPRVRENSEQISWVVNKSAGWRSGLVPISLWLWVSAFLEAEHALSVRWEGNQVSAFHAHLCTHKDTPRCHCHTDSSLLYTPGVMSHPLVERGHPSLPFMGGTWYQEPLTATIMSICLKYHIEVSPPYDSGLL